jgi:hypothetical protein
LVYGRYLPKYGIRISGLVLGKDEYGVQINALRKLTDMKYFNQNVSLLSGISKAGNSVWEYVGAAYDLNLLFLFLEFDATVGHGDFENPQFGAQIGIVYRSRKISEIMVANPKKTE